MSNREFPPRVVFSRPYQHAVEFSITDFNDFGDRLEYLSLKEHQALLQAEKDKAQKLVEALENDYRVFGSTYAANAIKEYRGEK